MKCQNCGMENADGARFCKGCGVELNQNNGGGVDERSSPRSTTIQWGLHSDFYVGLFLAMNCCSAYRVLDLFFYWYFHLVELRM